MGCMEHYLCSCAEIGVPLDLRLVSLGISVVSKGIRPLVMFDVEHGIAMEPMKGKWASSRADLGYTKLFYIPNESSVPPVL